MRHQKSYLWFLHQALTYLGASWLVVYMSYTLHNNIFLLMINHVFKRTIQFMLENRNLRPMCYMLSLGDNRKILLYDYVLHAEGWICIKAAVWRIAWPYALLGNFALNNIGWAIIWSLLINYSSNPFWVYTWATRSSTYIPTAVQ